MYSGLVRCSSVRCLFHVPVTAGVLLGVGSFGRVYKVSSSRVNPLPPAPQAAHCKQACQYIAAVRSDTVQSANQGLSMSELEFGFNHVTV